MKILIFGPSGSGKTYLSSELRKLGINAVDADLVEGLSSWCDGAGKKIEYPRDADKEFLDNHSFLWYRDFLIYLFGASGNLFDTLNLFDKVYFLKVEPELQKERLIHESRENPMGQTEYQRENSVKWGLELEVKAKQLNIPFVDAALKPKEIYERMSSLK